MDENLSAMSAPATHLDIEAPHSSPPEEKLDIEHAFVEDDPRKWSSTRKVRNLCLSKLLPLTYSY